MARSQIQVFALKPAKQTARSIASLTILTLTYTLNFHRRLGELEQRFTDTISSHVGRHARHTSWPEVGVQVQGIGKEGDSMNREQFYGEVCLREDYVMKDSFFGFPIESSSLDFRRHACLEPSARTSTLNPRVQSHSASSKCAKDVRSTEISSDLPPAARYQ